MTTPLSLQAASLILRAAALVWVPHGILVAQTSAAADTIYVNAKVVTVDPSFSIAQAFALSGDKFVAVGEDAAIRKLATPTTHVVDLGGRTVVPGFIDAHPHTVNGHDRQEELKAVSLFRVRSVAEILERIGNAAAKATPGAWIVTTAIGDPPDFFALPESLAEKRWPTRGDLDKAAPHNPVYVPGASEQPYPAVFNSAALVLLGVTRATPDEDRVRYLKDPSGEPTGLVYGVLYFNNTSPLKRKLQSLLPADSPELRKEVIKRAMQDNISVGVTSLYEGHGTQPITAQYLRELKAAGELTNRFVLAYEIPRDLPLPQIDAWMKEHAEALGRGTGDDMLKIVGATVSVDGPVQHGAAWMTEPYLAPYDKMGNGTPAISPEKVIEIARLAAKNDLRLNGMAAGSQACATVVTAFETVNRETPIKDRRWVVEHFQHPTREQIAKLSQMGVVAQTYSSVDFSKGAETYIKRFPGQDVWKSNIPLRWWIDGGVSVAQSTDGAHYDPMFTIWESLVRVDGRTGQSLLTPAKTITRKEAIQIYTINGARVMQSEDRIGSIEAGKLADFVVLDHDILTVPVAQIPTTKVVLTAIGGKVVYDSR